MSNFNKAIGQSSRLYSGHEYISYARIIKGNALYPMNAETWEQGEVNYDGIVYENVPMMYDIYKDLLVVLLYNHFSAYSLVSEKVHDFTFWGRHFVRIDADSLRNDKAGISSGFYEQLYGGNKVEVLARRSKSIQNSTSQATVLETFFSEKNDYYIRKGSVYYKIGSKGAILDVLKDKKPVLQKYMRDNNIKYGNDPEAAMAALANYYDHLLN